MVTEWEAPLITAFEFFLKDPLKGKYRYRLAFGGRGGGKSIFIADALLGLCLQQKLRVLCAREIQKSIKDSVHTLLRDRIELYGFTEFEVLKTEIINKDNGSNIMFSGLREHNVDSIKSYQGINICWLEEAQAICQRSLNILTPTIREENSEIWASYNRFGEDDPIHSLFRKVCKGEGKQRSDKKYKWIEYEGKNAVGVFANYDANPYFPKVLREEMESDKKLNYELYLHKWGGEPLQEIDNCLIPRELVMKATENKAGVWEKLNIGVDPARYGDDESVICWQHGNQVQDFITFKGINTNLLTDKIIQLCRQIRSQGRIKPATPIKIKVDDTGVGGGVTDQLQSYAETSPEYNIIVIPMINNSASTDKYYKDWGAQMWGNIKDCLPVIEIPYDTVLIAQLTSRIYKVRPDHSIELEKKDDMKKRGLTSPDRADALALCVSEKYEQGFTEQKKGIKKAKSRIAGIRGDGF